jgi:hypothetical protein
MGTCTHPDIEVNVHVVKQRMLDDEAAKNGTIHCISYFKADAENIQKRWIVNMAFPIHC